MTTNAQNDLTMRRWVHVYAQITHEFFERDQILPEDPPNILMMLVDEYEPPVYKRLIESQVDGLTPTERDRLEYECIFGTRAVNIF